MSDPRLLIIKDTAYEDGPVVYVMSRDQRAHDNHALLAAQNFAISHNAPLYVLFVLKSVKSRSREHFEFMLAGLEELAATLQSKNIPFILRSGDTIENVTGFANEIKAGALFFDFSPLTPARLNIKKIASGLDIPIIVVDTHNIIPVWIASDKQEFAAHTFRRKIHQHLSTFLVVPPSLKKHAYTGDIVPSITFDEARKIIQTIPASGITVGFKPGEKAAKKQLQAFLESDIERYALLRNNIATDHQSGLSPYLHFGQLSSLRVALETTAYVDEVPLLMQYVKLAQHGETPSAIDGMDTLLEEMVVRKELSDNFCFYNKSYMSLKGAPAWAQTSLASHADDPREFVYTQQEWEACDTHDEVWNASQTELNKTGKLHGYLRMYWAKKLLEWSASPEEALQTAIYLNDKYSIDGGDPNGYVGILWSITGLHDRPWFERPVYGKVRYMNAAGLRRKYDVDAYIKRVS